jgi:glycosyltransferase involved in cell wall biosynthesis
VKTLVAFPSTAIFGQQVALAFHERGALAGYLTAFAYRPNGLVDRTLKGLPGDVGRRVATELGRRAVNDLPADYVETRPFWEIARTLAQKAGATVPVVDRLWDHMSRDFTRAAARRLSSGVEAIYAYEYTALEAFEAAERRGVAKILDFPSLNSRQYEELERREKARFPELIGRNEAYFDARFESRQKRRDAELARADVIIANSSVTRASHIAGGADPAKIFAVPYGAPPTIDAVLPRNRHGPLRVVWAGTFGIRKGAHLFIAAWENTCFSANAVADVYGSVALPDRILRPAQSLMNFHGSVVRSVLFDAFEKADILVFPTLSDGFGMVATEAFARGLPVIITDQAGASDLVQHESNGLIIPAGSAEAIAGALEWCLNNRDRLAAMRSAALLTAKNWQWVDYRRKLIEAVATGLARAGHNPPWTEKRAAAAYA